MNNLELEELRRRLEAEVLTALREEQDPTCAECPARQFMARLLPNGVILADTRQTAHDVADSAVQIVKMIQGREK
jgi:hypothetical protein